jgi:hypothetical protein
MNIRYKKQLESLDKSIPETQKKLSDLQTILQRKIDKNNYHEKTESEIQMEKRKQDLEK